MDLRSLATPTRTWIVIKIRSMFWASGHGEWTWDPEPWLRGRMLHTARVIIHAKMHLRLVYFCFLICFVIPGGDVLAHGGRWVHRAQPRAVHFWRGVAQSCAEMRARVPVPDNHRPIHAPRSWTPAPPVPSATEDMYPVGSGSKHTCKDV